MIYYLEDDEQIRNLALCTLEQTGHATRGFSRASEMDIALASEVPDLFLLDVMLPDEDVLEAGPICLDVARYQVTAAGAEVQLTHKEFEMLRYLMENRGIVVSRDLLLDRVWGYSIAGETRTVDAHVQTLRKKLSEACPEAATYIETVRGVGYRLKA